MYKGRLFIYSQDNTHFVDEFVRLAVQLNGNHRPNMKICNSLAEILREKHPQEGLLTYLEQLVFFSFEHKSAVYRISSTSTNMYIAVVQSLSFSLCLYKPIDDFLFDDTVAAPDFKV
jgi:hypothetical protein